MKKILIILTAIVIPFFFVAKGLEIIAPAMIMFIIGVLSASLTPSNIITSKQTRVQLILLSIALVIFLAKIGSFASTTAAIAAGIVGTIFCLALLYSNVRTSTKEIALITGVPRWVTRLPGLRHLLTKEEVNQIALQPDFKEEVRRRNIPPLSDEYHQLLRPKIEDMMTAKKNYGTFIMQ